MRSISVSAAIRGGIVATALFVVASCGEPRPTAISSGSSAAFSRSPSLMACPTNQTLSTSAVIDVLGGTVSIGGMTVTIPAGALSLPTVISITVPASQYLEIDVRANALLSFVFNQPVSVTIDYSRCNRADIGAVPLTVWHIDPMTHQLLENMGGVDDKANRSITFTTGHFSGYAVAF
jgi:hypothetical protein